MKKEILYLTTVILVVSAGAIIFYLGGKASIEEKRAQMKEELASCLSEKKIKLYGYSPSQFSSTQKDIFKEAFSQIKYIECKQDEDGWSAECVKKGVNNVPAWSFPKDIIGDKVISCIDCARKSNEIFCKDDCYIVSKDEKEFIISGFLSLERLNQISNCQIDLLKES